MDTDLSHETIKRFEALEARVDALEGGGEKKETATVQIEAEKPDEESDEDSSSSSPRSTTRSRRRY